MARADAEDLKANGEIDEFVIIAKRKNHWVRFLKNGKWHELPFQGRSSRETHENYITKNIRRIIRGSLNHARSDKLPPRG